MAPRAGPISGPFRNCGRRLFTQAFHAKRHRRTSAILLKTPLTRFWERHKTQNVRVKFDSRILSRRLKGTVFHCFRLSPCHHGHWRAFGGSRQRTPIHPTAVLLSDGGSLPRGGHGHWSRAGAYEGRYRERPYRLASYRLRQAPLGFWPSDYPAALGFPQSPPSHRAPLPSGLTGCTDECTLRDLTVGILRPLRRALTLGLDTSLANQR